MAASSLSASAILSLVSFSMLFQALFMPAIGNVCDKYGALRIMGIGFFSLGAIGFLLLGITGHQLINFLPSYIWVGGCFVLIALGLGMSSYEAAFTATIQLDEKNARKKISIITFYGGVASTVSWLLPDASIIVIWISHNNNFGQCSIMLYGHCDLANIEIKAN